MFADMLRRLIPYLILVLLAGLFFAPLLLHPQEVLYSDHSDLLALHLPVKRFFVGSWQETGTLPLWCPYSFAGLPLVHDVQTAAFYPPHWLLYFVPEAQIGAALSWLVVAHGVLAGWLMYGYGRYQGLGPTAALVAAAGFMFAGRWLLHILIGGHYIMIPLAWLPLALLLLERAIRQATILSRLVNATWAGAAFSLIILGTHPQITFYAGLFLALWTLVPALEEAGYLGAGGPHSPRRTFGALVRWLGLGAWSAAVAAGLSAVQLLPALEAAPLSTRAPGVQTWVDILQAGPRVLLFLVGPALTTEPSNLQWEDRGGLTLLWLAAALMAPLLNGPRVRCQFFLCLLLFVFALGGALAVQGLPGFRLFRQPARMLIVAGLPLAFLAGATTQALLADPGPEKLARCRRILVQAAVAVLILAGGFTLRLWLQGQPVRFHIYWLSLLVTVPAAFWLLSRHSLQEPRKKAAWLALLLLDLWALSRPAVAVRPETASSAPSACVDYLRQAAGSKPGRVLDRQPDVTSHNTPLGAGAHQALRWRLEPVRGYNSFDVRRYREYLQLIAGDDTPWQPFANPFTFADVGNFPIQNKSLLDLLGTRYLVQPSDMALPRNGWQKVFEETAPEAYDFEGGGVKQLPAYTIYENRSVLPRAFMVPAALPLPATDGMRDHLLAADFRQVVFLEGWENGANRGQPAKGYHRSAKIEEYLPNSVTIRVADGPAGFLVLTDPWFPGWSAFMDGQPARLYRADYVFRGLPVPPGEHRIVFRFLPDSLRKGQIISATTAAFVLTLSLYFLAGRAACGLAPSSER